jgi:hypothetical protein
MVKRAATTRNRHNNSRMPSASTMLTQQRAMWLQSAMIEPRTRNSIAAAIKERLSPSPRVPTPPSTSASEIGTMQTMVSEKTSAPLARSGLAATVYSFSERSTNISWPSTASTLPIWQMLSHIARWPKSAAENPRAASENMANETTAPTNCITMVPTTPWVTSRPKIRAAASNSAFSIRVGACAVGDRDT